MMLKPLFAPVLAVFLVCASVQDSGAANVLTIDISNPAAVIFTSTPALSQTNSSLNIGFDGFTIQNFFVITVLVPSSTVATGNLQPTGSTMFYGGTGSFNYEANNGVFTTGNDLSVFSNGGAPLAGSQVFSTGLRAFNGVMTIDFSSFAAALPTAGSTGTIYSGYLASGTPGQGLVVGQYSVVPEPSTIALGLIGLAGLTSRRRSLI